MSIRLTVMFVNPVLLCQLSSNTIHLPYICVILFLFEFRKYMYVRVCLLSESNVLAFQCENICVFVKEHTRPMICEVTHICQNKNFASLSTSSEV